MRKRIASINEAPIRQEERRISVPEGGEAAYNTWLADQAGAAGGRAILKCRLKSAALQSWGLCVATGWPARQAQDRVGVAPRGALHGAWWAHRLVHRAAPLFLCTTRWRTHRPTSSELHHPSSRTGHWWQPLPAGRRQPGHVLRRRRWARCAALLSLVAGNSCPGEITCAGHVIGSTDVSGCIRTPCALGPTGHAV